MVIWFPTAVLRVFEFAFTVTVIVVAYVAVCGRVFSPDLILPEWGVRRRLLLQVFPFILVSSICFI